MITTTDGELRGGGRPAGHGAVRVEVVRDETGLRALEPDWERLWDADPTADIFASFDWFLNWWEHFGNDGHAAPLVSHDGSGPITVPGGAWRLHILVVRDAGNRLLALLPLVGIRGVYRGESCRILSTPVNGHAPRAGVLASAFGKDVVAALVDALADEPACDVLLLGGLANSGRMAQLNAGLAAHGLLPGPVATGADSYLRFHGAWEEFFASKGRHFRKRCEWAERDLGKLGSVTAERFCGGEAATRGMGLFLEIDRASWKAGAGETIDSNTVLRNYYTGVCARLGARGRAEVWVLRVGGKAAAAYICLTDGRARYTLKTSFREGFGSNQHSPSNVLLSRIIRESWGATGVGIDFVGKMHFVERWANEERQYQHTAFYRHRLLALRVDAREALRRWVTRVREAARRVGRKLAPSSSVAGSAEGRPSARVATGYHAGPQE